MAEQHGRTEPRAVFQTAPALEAVFALQAFVHPEQRPFARAWADELAAKLTPQAQRWRELLQTLPDQIWLADVAFYARILTDPLALSDRLAALTDDELAHAALDPDLPLEEVMQRRREPDGAARLLKDRPWLWGGNGEAVALCLQRPGDLREACQGLLLKVWRDGVVPMLPELERLWQATLDQVQGEAAGVPTAEFARRVFGAPFGRRYGPNHVWQTYVFAPSYFVSPIRVAMFDPDRTVITLDARLGPWLLREVRGRLVESLRALADDSRLDILRLLGHQPGYGAWIASRLKLQPATVTHHLAVLRRAGLIAEAEPPPGAAGAAKYFRTDRAAFAALLEQLRDYVHDVLEPGDPPGPGADRGPAAATEHDKESGPGWNR